MTQHTFLRDQPGYLRYKPSVDFELLQLAASEAGTTGGTEFYKRLHDLGIGDAQREDKISLSQSTTGAIGRAALWALMGNGLLQRAYDAPTFRYRITERGRLRLEEMQAARAAAGEAVEIHG